MLVGVPKNATTTLHCNYAVWLHVFNACAMLTTHWLCRQVWWIDPVGAILISCYIVWTWIGIASEQMNLMVCRHLLGP